MKTIKPMDMVRKNMWSRLEGLIRNLKRRVENFYFGYSVTTILLFIIFSFTTFSNSSTSSEAPDSLILAIDSRSSSDLHLLYTSFSYYFSYYFEFIDLVFYSTLTKNDIFLLILELFRSFLTLATSHLS
jgi:hypothetical protein